VKLFPPFVGTIGQRKKMAGSSHHLRTDITTAYSSKHERATAKETGGAEKEILNLLEAGKPNRPRSNVKNRRTPWKKKGKEIKKGGVNRMLRRKGKAGGSVNLKGWGRVSGDQQKPLLM